MEHAYLVLSDGTVFEGERLGAAVDTIGELVFTTGICGYLQTLTDPCYAGQIVTQTFPLIGNYGVIEEDLEGPCTVKGYVVRECCEAPSNFRCNGDLDSFLKEQGIPGIRGVDTRQLTRHIRDNGVMNAAICQSIPEDLTVIRTYAPTGLAQAAGDGEVATECPEGEQKFRVALLNFGSVNGIRKALCQRGCEVITVPYGTSAQAILALQPDGVVLSDGPGDPADNAASVEEIKQLLGKLPVFGIGLGHQLMALALGGKTFKLKYGHRGANQPVRDCTKVATYITTQNHGYCVDAESLQEIGTPLMVNANDGSCEAMDYPGMNCFSVQFHPEECTGPRNPRFLYDRFVDMMGGTN